jgi:cell division control protein 6
MSDVIEDELFSSSVIKDLNTLNFDYVPEELPHRDEQLRFLSQMFKPLLSRVSQNVVIRVPVAPGKTIITKKIV